MAMICGAISLGEQSARAMLHGVSATLNVYGAATEWHGTAGAWSAAVRSFNTPASSPHITAAGAIICADVFLHDRDDLCDQLGAQTSASDVELVGAAYDRWGRDMCQRLSGNYAIAVVDQRRGGLFVARDHSGSRFLALHEQPGAVAFASTALALTGFPGVGHELDSERLAELAVAAYGTTRTFVQGVESLAPGSWRWIDAGQRTTKRWWHPERLEIVDDGSIGRHAEILREVFDRAVTSTLRGTDRVGVLLSGGLDSASVAAVAARQIAPRQLNSYTSVPPPDWSGPVPMGCIPSEQFAVEALAAITPNLSPRFIHLRGASIFDHQRDLWELGGGPDRNPLNAVWEHECVRDAAADGLHILLTGGGGNHGFSADGPLWLAELTRQLRFPTLLREMEAWRRSTGRSVPASLRRLVLWPLLPAAYRTRRAKAAGVDALSDWLSATAILQDRLAGIDLTEVLAEVAQPHPDGWTRDLTRLFMVTGAQAETEAAYRLRFGVELRDPTSDLRLTEVAAQQPEWWRRHDGATRAICRAAMTDVLPVEIVQRRTLGAQLPDWLDRMTDSRDEIGVELQAMRDHPASRQVFDVHRLQALFDSWPDRTRTADNRTIYDYQSALMRSIVLSRYARWFEERGRRVAAGGPAVVLGEPI